SLLFSPHRLPPPSTLFPYTTLFRSHGRAGEQRFVAPAGGGPEARRQGLVAGQGIHRRRQLRRIAGGHHQARLPVAVDIGGAGAEDRKSTRLNSSHVKISYAVFCLKK